MSSRKAPNAPLIAACCGPPARSSPRTISTSRSSRLQQLHRLHPRPRPSQRGRCAHQTPGSRGGRRAVYVQHHRRRRRHRDGPWRHEISRCPSRELIADCVETDDQGALLRRHGLHPQLRQDRARHAHGRHARQHPDHLRQRRPDGRGHRRNRHRRRPSRRTSARPPRIPT